VVSDPATVQMWASVIGTVINALTLVAILVYVVKTWQIATDTARSATSTERSAAATEVAAKATEQSARISEATLGEMREARQAESAPYIVVYLDVQPNGWLVDLVIKNVGQTAASTVQISFDPPLAGKISADGDVPLPNFVTDGIAYMPPSFSLRSLMWSSFVVFGQGAQFPLQYTAAVSYTDSRTGTRHSESYALDLNVFQGTLATTQRTLTDIYEELRHLVKEQAATVTAIQSIEGVVSRGIVIVNSSLLTDNLSVYRSPDDATRIKLLEIKRVWRSWRSRDDDDRYREVDALIRLLRSLQSQLQRSAADVQDTGLVSAVELYDHTLTDLITHRFYVDGGASYKRFDQLGESLLSFGAPEEQRGEQ
jgi:hypothetical protein